jgi:hypothetical protein
MACGVLGRLRRDGLLRQLLAYSVLLEVGGHQSPLGLACSIATDADTQCSRVAANSQRGMLPLHFGRLGINLLRIQSAPMLPQNSVDSVSDAARNVFCLFAPLDDCCEHLTTRGGRLRRCEWC